jgi:hypothetical protein
MFETCMICARKDEMRKSELVNTMETLHLRTLEEFKKNPF